MVSYSRLDQRCQHDRHAFGGVVVPFTTHCFGHWSTIVVGVACVLIVFHPISMACHYGIPSKEGRAVYLKNGGDYPYATCRELVWSVVTVAAAIAVGWFVSTRQ